MKLLLPTTTVLITIAAGGAAASNRPIDWTGFYIGLNAGYLWSNNDSVDTTTTTVYLLDNLNGDIGDAIATQGTGNVPTKIESFIGGGQIGYNKQYNKNFVLGLEADFQGLSDPTSENSILNSGFVPNVGSPVTSTGIIESSESLDYLGTFRGRIGVLAVPRLFTYVTGGLAYGGVRTDTTITEELGYSDTTQPFGTSGSLSETSFGWTVGGGIEWMFAPNWSAKAEYLYYDLGTVTNELPPFALYTDSGTLATISESESTVNFAGNTVRAGINYNFRGL